MDRGKPPEEAEVNLEVQQWLPLHITAKIFTFLPVKSLFRFKCVCKAWNSSISDPNFRLSYVRQDRVFLILSREKGKDDEEEKEEEKDKAEEKGEDEDEEEDEDDDYDDDEEEEEEEIPSFLSIGGDFAVDNVHNPFGTNPKIIGSCDGLFLVCVSNSLYLWNPSTTYTKVFMENISNIFSKYLASGLCYVESEKDYKAVFLVVNNMRMSFVGSLRGKTWASLPFPYFKECDQIGVTIKENIHWKLRDKNGSIIYYDSEMNKFDKLPFPQSFLVGDDFALGTLDGNLSMTVFVPVESCVQVMIMEEYGVKESWKVLIRLRLPSWDFSGILLRARCGDEYLFGTSQGLVVCNARQNEYRVVKKLALREHLWGATYKERLEGVDDAISND